MKNEKYAKAITEVIHYLKGIRVEDYEKIPKKIINYLEENSSKEYKCEFDYNKPLSELELLDETKGMIGILCYNYWSDTSEKKEKFMNILKENSEKNQEELKKKYDVNNIFNNFEQNEKIDDTNSNAQRLPVKKEKWYKKILNFFIKKRNK